MPIRAIGFDFDQTLADSSLGIANCLRYVSKECGVDTPDSIVDALSVSGRSLIDTLSEFVPTSQMEFAAAYFMKIYPIVGIEGTSTFLGVEELLAKLKSMRYEIYVLSAKTHSNLLLSLSHLNLEVDEAIGSLGYDGKVAAIRACNLEFYVGDQMSDMKAASEGGSRGILVNNKSNFDSSTPIYLRYHSIKDLSENITSLLNT